MTDLGEHLRELAVARLVVDHAEPRPAAGHVHAALARRRRHRHVAVLTVSHKQE